ncbi:hypothetical protein RYX36_000664 [Vicia faba]
MSLTGRPRVIVNGVRRMRTFHYFWCLNCQRTVRIPSTNTIMDYGSFCPYCFHQLLYELDISRPRLLMNNPNNMEPPPTTNQLMGSLAFILDPSFRRQNQNNTTLQWETEHEHDQNQNRNPQTWITLRFVRPIRPPRPNAPPPLQNLVPRLNDNDTPSLDELFDGVIHNNIRPGPPPASPSAIEALPMVKVTEAHLASDPNCPICKDEFEVDLEVKELPCKHFYHSDCILPWLRMHNTCPVCRHELQGIGNSNNANYYSFHNENEYDRFIGFEELTSSFIWIWSQIASIRPIRAVLDWTRSHFSGRNRSKIKLLCCNNFYCFTCNLNFC